MNLKMRRWKEAHLRELLFRVSVWMKGLDAALEIAGGIALWAISPGLIWRAVGCLTQDEIAEDPRDFVANHLRHAVSHFSIGSEHFMSIYLLGHGVVKVFVVVALLRNRLWAYPLSLVVFGGFVVYQIYRFTLTHSIGLIALTVLDLIVMWLIWLEYRAVRLRVRAHAKSA